MTFDTFAFVILVLMFIAVMPVWPWTRRLGARPAIAAGLCLAIFAILKAWDPG